MLGVILAAGRNERLIPHVPAFHKPLIVLGGQPLVRSAVNLALQKCSRVVVVVAPQNAEPIASVLPDLESVRMVVQMKPTGPADAVLLARPFLVFDDEPITLMMGDNTFDPHSVFKMWEANFRCIVGVTHDPPHEHQLYELKCGGMWWCGPVVTDRTYSLMESLDGGAGLAETVDELHDRGYICHSRDIGTPGALP